MNSFQQKIKDLRTKKMLTQFDLAQQLGVSQSTISAWESGRSTPPLRRILLISRSLSVPVSFLIPE